VQTDGQGAKKRKYFEAIFQAADQLKVNIGSTQLKSALKEISRHIQNFANGLLDQKIEAKKVGPIKLKYE